MSKNRTDRKRERNLDAVARQASYAELTTVQKLDRLPSDGAKRQRIKLTTRAVAVSGVLPAMIIAAVSQAV